MSCWRGKPDRLYRRLRDLENPVRMLARNSVAVDTVRAARINLSTAADRLNARLLGLVATYELEVKSEPIAVLPLLGGPRREVLGWDASPRVGGGWVDGSTGRGAPPAGGR